MSVAIWPSLPPSDLEAAIRSTEDRELAWQLEELCGTLRNIRASLSDCYDLLGNSDSTKSSTLVVTTQRNEIVKGTVTRLGTRIVRGTIHLKMRTLPQMTLTVDPRRPLSIAPLGSLHTLLTRSLELLDMTLGVVYGQDTQSPLPQPVFIAAQLRVLAQALQDASAILDGPANSATDPLWATMSSSLSHFTFTPPPASASATATPLPPLSFYLGLQESQLVLWLRALEPAGAPVNLGLKFALAIGTTRRLEHDEAEKTFKYCCEDGKAVGLHVGENGQPVYSETGPASVHVREKLRIESADPSLLSLSAKLLALAHTLLMARRNLAAVMGEELEE